MIPRGEDFDYFVPRNNNGSGTATSCLSDNVRPHMFRGRTLDLQFGATGDETYHPNVTHIWAKGMSTQHHGFDSIGTISMETKTFEGAVIHRKIVIRDNKGRLAAIVKRMEGVEDWQKDVVEIYSVRPRYAHQTPTWGYKDLPLYCWARVNPNDDTGRGGCSGTSSFASCSPSSSSAPSYSLETTGNENEELYLTHEVGSKLTRRRKMVIEDLIHGYTRAYACQRYRPSPKQCQSHPCSSWKAKIGPSTDPFLVIAFVACIEQLQQNAKHRI